MIEKIELVTEDGYLYFYAEITQKEDSFVDFNVYEVDSWHCDSINTPVNPKLYLLGTIKWDGCSHIYFSPDNYKHLCGKEYFKRHGEMLMTLYEKVVLLIPNYNKDIGG